MGFQFVHLQTFARKPNKAGQSTTFVLDEASRRPDASLHVADPRPPELVHGVSLDVLRGLHDERAEAARVTDATGKEKRVRTDQHTLATVVASHPGGTLEEVARWERLTLAWLRESYGERLVSVVRHVDEKHPHLHAYVLPDDAAMKARALHPGVSAKEEAKRAAAAAGDDAKTANAKGDKAYKAAMRAWQDGYWERVGRPCGLARVGPGRRRLSRSEWQAEKAQAARAGLVERRLAVVDKAEETVTAWREEVAVLRAEREEAIRAAEKAKRDADAARKEGAAILDTARRRASRILERAREDASALRGLASSVGAAVGGLWQGLLASSPSRVAEAVRQDLEERHGREVGELRRDLRAARQEAQEARQDAQGWRGAVGRLREQVADLQAVLASRAPTHAQDLAKRQDPRG